MVPICLYIGLFKCQQTKFDARPGMLSHRSNSSAGKGLLTNRYIQTGLFGMPCANLRAGNARGRLANGEADQTDGRCNGVALKAHIGEAGARLHSSGRNQRRCRERKSRCAIAENPPAKLLRLNLSGKLIFRGFDEWLFETHPQRTRL